MKGTPLANRKTIVIIGNRNSGKSTLFNKIIGQEKSIVSTYPGTTTDPVIKAMELIGFGPVKIVDTAGIDDVGQLGEMRAKKSEEEMLEGNLIVHVISIEDIFSKQEIDLENTKSLLEEKIKPFKEKYKKLNKKYLFVINKCDKCNNKEIWELNEEFVDVIFTASLENSKEENWYDLLISKITETLKDVEEEVSLTKGLLKPGDTALLVVPIDSEAPKGRLILPQVQLIRDCLDNGIKVIVTRDAELEECIEENPKIDLVVIDSKIFGKVSKILPQKYRLTSFSILFARQKGDINQFLEGAKAVENLSDGDKVLISESCTHTTSHEDIGTILIPKSLKKKTGKNINFDFINGRMNVENLSDYSLIVQCGGCMMTRINMLNRISSANEKNIPITNYGVLLAYLNGVFERAIY